MQISFIVSAIIIIWIVFIYNTIITKRNKADAAWSDIDVQLNRRYDLIPNLVRVVQGYTSHEQNTLTHVVEARSTAMNILKPSEKGKAEKTLSSAVNSLFALAEAYPDLKANKSFLTLHDQLVEIENNLQSARRFYNGNVRLLNTTLESFPGNVVARLFSFKTREFFQLDNLSASDQVVVKV